MNMPKTKDGGFLMDDGDMMPYKVPPKKDIKPVKPRSTEKKSKVEKKEINDMPLLKDGSFLLDDSDCDPYGVVKMREKMQNEKRGKLRTTSKDGGFWLDDSTLTPYGNKKIQEKPKSSAKKSRKGKK